MDYEPKIIPEGINTSKEHPLREFFVLVLGLAAVIVLITGLLFAATDFLIRYIPVEKENQWFAAESWVDGEILPSDLDHPLESEVEERLLQLIEALRHGDKPGYRFSLQLIHTDVPNAFVLPGGHIFVTSGLLGSVQSENGLAMVLAHEMAHQYLRHPLRGLGRGVVMSLALMVISGTDSETLVESFVGSTALLTSLGFSRDQEREADRLGLELLMRHYGHAGGADEFFETMQDLPQTDSEPPEFLSTHPGLDERLDLLRAHSREFGGDKTPLPGVIDRYLAADAKL